MRRNTNIAVAIVAALILVLWTFGALTSISVPFSNMRVPFRDALGSLRHVSVTGDTSFLLVLVPMLIAVALLAGFIRCSSRRRRFVITSASLILPLFPMLFFDPLRAIALFFFLPFSAPSTTVGMFTGTLDGETWSEGFVALAATGWWSILWLVVLLCELIGCVELDVPEANNTPDGIRQPADGSPKPSV